jgi:hypothetical protein
MAGHFDASATREENIMIPRSFTYLTSIIIVALVGGIALTCWAGSAAAYGPATLDYVKIKSLIEKEGQKNIQLAATKQLA